MTPENRLMLHMPKKPLALSAIFSLILVFLVPLITYIVLWFFEIRDYTFLHLAAWKVIYSLVLAMWVCQLTVLRFVQNDCASPDDPPQTGTEQVLEPLPKKESIKRGFDVIANDVGFNIILGLFTGSTLVQDGSVILLPFRREGILILAMILSVIIAIAMVHPIAKSMRELRESGKLPLLPERSPLIAWLPEKPALFALTLTLPIILVAVLFFSGVMALFGFSRLNFFQLLVIRTVFVNFLAKPVTAVAASRYMQPPKPTAAGKTLAQ